MHDYTLTHLCDAVLIRDLLALVARDRATTATLLAHIAEVDDRKLFRPAGYPSMHAYCVDELHLSEDAAKKRIQAARASRQFPMLFTALAEGRLHGGALCMLAPHLTSDNAAMLVEAATHKSKCEVEGWLVHRYPLQEALARTVSVSPIPVLTQPAAELVPVAPLDEGAPGHPEGTQVQCLSQNSARFMVQFTVTKSTRDKLRHAQDLLSHAIEPLARGGESTIDNMRMRCRAHNQYEAERVFGSGFMI